MFVPIAQLAVLPESHFTIGHLPRSDYTTPQPAWQ